MIEESGMLALIEGLSRSNRHGKFLLSGSESI